jgi:DNA replication and repair protein RecF
LQLTLLRAKYFRNLEELHLAPGRGLNLFLGENAQGKTSVLEAIYLLSFVKSFRTNKLNDLIQFSEEACLVGGTIKNQIEHEIKIRIGKETGKYYRKIENNGKPTTPGKLFGKLKTVAFTPESLAAVKLGPEIRRDLIDDAALLFFTEAPDVQSRFLRVLKQKGALLKQIKNEEISHHHGWDMLKTLNDLFLEAASDLIFLRQKVSSDLQPFATEALSQILGQKVDLSFEPVSQEKVWLEKDMEAITARQKRELLSETTQKIEQALGKCYAGPQRHDYIFLFNGKDARFFCSQGQQRAVILAFKIAQIVYHKLSLNSLPLLLLDDVLSEFDERRQKYLIDFLQNNEAQTFLTTTEYNKLLKSADVFNVKSGKVSRVAE